MSDLSASPRTELDDGACDRCDGSGHSQDVDGQLCSKCGGSGRLDDPDEFYACNFCAADSFSDARLGRRVGKSCPYCGEGVIQLIEDE